ncbi:hypothetical protein [uncultured Roseovarius sp.]|nr:hypothetical protein [uncultured Roseovarius sp.]
MGTRNENSGVLLDWVLLLLQGFIFNLVISGLAMARPRTSTGCGFVVSA